jgi:hypothetical protein
MPKRIAAQGSHPCIRSLVKKEKNEKDQNKILVTHVGRMNSKTQKITMLDNHRTPERTASVAMGLG